MGSRHFRKDVGMVIQVFLIEFTRIVGFPLHIKITFSLLIICDQYLLSTLNILGLFNLISTSLMVPISFYHTTRRFQHIVSVFNVIKPQNSLIRIFILSRFLLRIPIVPYRILIF